VNVHSFLHSQGYRFKKYHDIRNSYSLVGTYGRMFLREEFNQKNALFFNTGISKAIPPYAQP